MAAHPSLSVIRISLSNGDLLGWILGHPINLSAELISQKLVCQFSVQASKKIDIVEQELYQLGGRFAAVLFPEDENPRLHLEPSGSLAAIYSVDQPIVAATPSLIPIEDTADVDHALTRVLNIPHQDSWIPFGLTS